MRLRVTLMPLLAALVVAAGCGGGGGSADQFKTAYSGADAQLRALGDDIGRAVSTAKGMTDAALAAEFNGFATRLRAIRDRLATLTPPDNAKTAFDRLRGGVDRVLNDLTAIAGAATAHDGARAKTATRQLFSDAPTVKDAAASVRRTVGITRSP